MAISVNFTAMKKKVSEERRLFQERWTLEYFFVKNRMKNQCVVFPIKSLGLPKTIILNDNTRQTILGFCPENCMEEMIESRK